MPATLRKVWTEAEVLALIDEQEDRSVRYEFADGELLVTPAPSEYHQRAIRLLYRQLDEFVERRRYGEVRLGPSVVRVASGTLFQPDIYVVPSLDGKRPRADVPVTKASLIVEVLSPGSIRHDRLTKRYHYLRGTVRDYWIVDLDGEVIERWLQGDDRPTIVDQRIEWRPSGSTEGEALVIDVAAFFRSVADE